MLARAELEQSPLADLHAIASELGVEGFRRLRREELIALLVGDGGGESAESPAPARRARRSTRSATSRRSARVAERDEPEEEATEAPKRRTRSRRTAAEPADETPTEAAEETRTGVLEILPTGGGLLRREALVQVPDDAYVSPAQIKRLELRAGDSVTGPVRPPRRSERHPALVRIDAVNGTDSDAATGRKRFEELTPVWASDRLPASDQPRQAPPFGKGSRVSLGGEPGAGATTLLRSILATLAEREPGIEQAVVLAGARPEEVTDWRRGSSATVTGGAFDAPIAELSRAAELAVERAKRTVERGGDALIAIDSLAFLPLETAHAVFGAARRAEEGGSLTIVAVTGSSQELRRLATTRVVLDAGRSGRSPGSLVSAASGTTRADLLG